MSWRALLAAVFLGCGSLPAQPLAVFEVATVKRSPPPEGDAININLGRVRDGMLTFGNASLSDCLRFAYGLVSDAQLDGPDWVKSMAVRFDIVAKTGADTPRDQYPVMLRALLAERLKLALHFEKKELPYLALVPGKNGSKLRPAAANGPPGGGLNVAGRVAGPQMSMLMLATLLSRFQRQTVIDGTGLAGLFQVNLQWSPDTGGAPVLVNGGPDPRPSLFSAVQEQLGLRLESRKGPVDVLVVDHAEQVPAEN